MLSGQQNETDAEPAVRKALASGAALEKLRTMITRQGGDSRVIDDYQRLPGAAHRHAVVAKSDGYLFAMHAELIGRASMALGAGRRRIEDRIDHGAGVLIAKKPGDAVRTGDTILELLYNDARGLEEAVSLVDEAIQVADQAPAVKPLVIGSLR